MPYIKEEDREPLDRFYSLFNASAKMPKTCGELNYLITMIVKKYIDTPSYTRINEAIGVLECAKLELYRRMAAPYEDEKAKENGDCYFLSSH